ncbi:TM0106 family RecB-like putative nuclease [Limnobacter alexandrii]|uniref:TM0106 family RecB-like putative nuclease n=1 Tax=Limnobacter alexandrii TaxID=2570352 RepID=UPI0011090924|nr:TM0106 family RecB-like putative nuclease [Limnobacter alexandrii]
MQKHKQQILFSASDLTYFAECKHRTWLDRCHLDTPMEKTAETESMRLIMDKGLEHEAAHLKALQEQGLNVAVIQAEDLAEKVRLTREAIHSGADVVFQATLRRDTYIGHADFLLRTNKKSPTGHWVYEVADTKLSHHTKTKFLVQLCFYSDLLSDITGQLPEQIHVELGNRHRDTFRVNDYFAYYSKLKTDFERSLSNHSSTAASYPDPCDLCSMCHWRDRCDEQRLKDDHLSQVANITKTQIVKLSAQGVRTMKALAQLAEPEKIKGLQEPTLLRLIDQAALQVHENETGEAVAKCLNNLEPGKGFERMPPPDEGDLFFDMEGDPMYPEGLEYLFGVYYFELGEAKFKAFWAHNRPEEGQAFSDFMNFVNNRLAQYPNAHIYHYAHYEKTALKRLMSVHGVHEDSVDNLLRHHKLVDLYKVVREGLRISKPSYSIKQVEKFYSTARTVEVTNAADSIVVYERWRHEQNPALLQSIEDYNFDDCKSTWELRQWLLKQRPATAAWFDKNRELPTKPLSDKDIQRAELRAQNQAIHEAYLAELPARLANGVRTQNLPRSYQQLLFQMIDFHKRAAKPGWWAIFERIEAEVEELLDDMEVIANLQFADKLVNGKIPRQTKWKFPEQEFKCKAGDGIKILDPDEMVSGTIHSIDEDNCELVLNCTRLPLKYIDPGQTMHISAGAPFDADIIADAVRRFVESEIEGDSDHAAVRQFLLRQPPRFFNKMPGDILVQDEKVCGQTTLQQTLALVSNMNKSCLFVQGPPGTGKTYTGSHVIAELIRQGKKVAISSNSHKAINNLVERTAQVLERMGHSYDGIKICSKEDQEVEGYGLTNCQKKDLFDDEALTKQEAPDLLAGTAWLFSSWQLLNCFDYLFIDEAGQVATANTVAMGQCADNIVLLGDQMQLGQPIQGDHPGESGLSTLEYLLGHKATIPADTGVFLDQSFRMHPDVCNYISNTFYEGRLRNAPQTEKQGLILSGWLANKFSATGVYCFPVEHDGNSQRSIEEADAIKRMYLELMEQRFIGPKGEVLPMNAEEIMVVAPYNAQVNLLKRVLPEGARVGTVDKFQGQEAQVVLVSMTTSNENHMPRYLEFLFSRNRLNVAVSRAKSLAVVVMSPGLAEVRSEKPETLGLINTFIGLVEK